MNILIDVLPTSVEINDMEYEINSDFRTSILFEILMQNDEINDEEKILKSLELYYDKMPHNLNESINKIQWFYSCGKYLEGDNKSDRNKSSENNSNTKIYDFNCDSEYIYAAFLDQYGIDLEEIDYLHWWKFKALFNSLKDDNKIVEIMGYRGVKLNTIKDDEQRKYYRKLQKIHALPISNNFENVQNALTEALKSGDIEAIEKLKRG